MAPWKRSQCKGALTHPLKTFYLQTSGSAHPPDLTVAPLMDDYRQLVSTQQFHAGRVQRYAIQFHRAAQDRQGGRHVSLYPDVIFLLNFVAWVQQFLRQGSIVRQQQ